MIRLAWTVTCIALAAGIGVAVALGSQPATRAPAVRIFDVKALGVAADGKAKDTAAIQKALDQCAAAGGGTVVVPEGAYLIGSIKLGSKTTLRLDKGATLLGSPDVADYPPMKVRWEGEWRDGHSALICAQNVSDVAIVGEGTIQGPPPALSRLRPPPMGSDMRGPSIFEPIEVNGLRLDGFSVRYQGMWTIHMTYCQNVQVSNLNIRTTGGNGDGIDVDSCKHVLIEKCDIDTGDDAIALKSGRGLDAVETGRPTEDVRVRDCTLGCSNFAGFAIGSEMSGGIRNVRVERCVFTSGRQNGIYIKSRPTRGGFIEDVTFSDLEFKDACATMARINLLSSGIEASRPVTGDDRFPRVKNIVFKNIKLDGVPALLSAESIPPERPIDGLTLSHISGTAGGGIALANIVNARLENIDVAVRTGPLLRLTNVKPAEGARLDEESVRGTK